MRKQTTLKNPALMPVRTYSDVLLIRSLGITLNKLAETAGYSSTKALTARLKPFKDDESKYFPLNIAAILEVCLWRLGYMSRYLALRSKIDGANRENNLPAHPKPWE